MLFLCDCGCFVLLGWYGGLVLPVCGVVGLRAFGVFWVASVFWFVGGCAAVLWFELFSVVFVILVAGGRWLV